MPRRRRGRAGAAKSGQRAACRTSSGPYSPRQCSRSARSTVSRTPELASRPTGFTTAGNRVHSRAAIGPARRRRSESTASQTPSPKGRRSSPSSASMRAPPDAARTRSPSRSASPQRKSSAKFSPTVFSKLCPGGKMNSYLVSRDASFARRSSSPCGAAWPRKLRSAAARMAGATRKWRMPFL